MGIIYLPRGTLQGASLGLQDLLFVIMGGGDQGAAVLMQSQIYSSFQAGSNLELGGLMFSPLLELGKTQRLLRAL